MLPLADRRDRRDRGAPALFTALSASSSTSVLPRGGFGRVLEILRTKFCSLVFRLVFARAVRTC
jgi:hypothetical protein